MKARLRVVLPPGSALCALLQQQQHKHVHTEEFPRASWEVLQAYAADQRGEVAAGRGPRRAPEIDERYRRYFRWAKERGQTGPEYLTMSAHWRCELEGPWVALEPNIVPYNMDPGIEHWNL